MRVCCLAGETGTPPPLECVEELSSCLLGYYSPHMLLYVAAAMQALQGHSAAGITSSLIRNGVLPLVGRPENLQVGVQSGRKLLLGHQRFAAGKKKHWSSWHTKK